MPDPKYTTITGAPDGLRSAFERAKQAAQDGRGIALLDPSGIGEPAFIVYDTDEFHEWIGNPSRVLDNSSMLTISQSDFAEAAFKQITDGVHPEQRH